MKGYIHSGVKGKMDRIFKPSPGKILVSDKLGNAVESNKTVTNLLSELEEDSKIGNLSNLTTTDKTNLVSAINEIAANNGGAEWKWNPTPAKTIILEDPWYDDTEDGPYGYQIVLSTPGKAVFVDIQPYYNMSSITGSVEIQALTTNNRFISVDIKDALSDAVEGNSCTARAFFFPRNGIYCGYGYTDKYGTGNDNIVYSAYPFLGNYSPTGYVTPLFDQPDIYINQILIFPSSDMLPAKTRIDIYVPATA